MAIEFRKFRWYLAFLIAAASDAVSLPTDFIPPIQWGIDLATALLLVLVLGWRWAFIAAIVPEAVPGLAMFPAWVLVVGALAVMDRKKDTPAAPQALAPLALQGAKAAVRLQAPAGPAKVLDRAELARVLAHRRAQGMKVVFTNGVFDLLHVGHLRYLAQARALGDLLVIGLNSDSSVKQLKGPKRPILPENERAELLAGLACVDHVCIFHETDPRELIKALRPNVLAKGGDWPVEKILGADTVLAGGGRVLSLPFVEGRSTTSIVDSIVERYAGGGFKE